MGCRSPLETGRVPQLELAFWGTVVEKFQVGGMSLE